MRSNSRAAGAAALFGLLAVAAIPAGILAAQLLASLALLRALYVSVPGAGVLGLLAVLLARRARLQGSRSVFAERRGLTRFAQLIAWAGLWAGVTGAVALAVYGALRWAQ